VPGCPPAQRLYAARRRANLSTQQTARAAGTAEETIVRAEAEEAPPASAADAIETLITPFGWDSLPTPPRRDPRVRRARRSCPKASVASTHQAVETIGRLENSCTGNRTESSPRVTALINSRPIFRSECTLGGVAGCRVSHKKEEAVPLLPQPPHR
jgi:hypothetical protein